MFGSQENSGVVPAYLRVWKEEWIHSAKLSNWSHPHTDTLATRHRQSILAPTQQHQTATQLAHSSPTPLQHHRSLSALRPSPARASRSVIVIHCPLPIARRPSPTPVQLRRELSTQQQRRQHHHEHHRQHHRQQINACVLASKLRHCRPSATRRLLVLCTHCQARRRPQVERAAAASVVLVSAALLLDMGSLLVAPLPRRIAGCTLF